MHCIERAWQRYAIVLSRQDIYALERQIATGQSLIVRRENNETVVHLVRHGGHVLVAVYGRARDAGGRMNIITFLPPESVKGGNQVRQKAIPRELRGGRNRRNRRLATALA